MPGKYLKGAFIQMMPTFLRAVPNVVIFQFNPESIVHTWQSAAPLITRGDNEPNPLAVKSLPAESFSFTLSMDSNDMIADGSPVAAGLATGSGIYSRLAALEMLLYPTGSFSASQLQGTVSAAANAARPIAYNVCCTERLSCAAKVSRSATRIRSRAEKSDASDRYVHVAVTDVASTRSSVSGNVVNSSRGKPENAESVVFNKTRLVTPDITVQEPLPSRTTSAVHCSPPGCTNA